MKTYIQSYPVQFDSICATFASFSLQVVEVGFVSATEEDYGEKPFTHLHRFNYITKGHPYYQCCSKKIELSPGDMIYLAPGTNLNVKNDGDIVEMVYINFQVNSIEQNEHFNQFINSLFPNKYLKDKNNKIYEIVQHLIVAGESKFECYSLEIQNMFEILFIQILRDTDNYNLGTSTAVASQSTDSIYNQAVIYITQNISKNIKVSDIADHVGISQIYLYKIFMNSYGKSVSQFIHDHRIILAKQYLANPTISIRAISAQLGYNTPAHFSNSFKKATGMAPIDYRHQATEK